MTLGERLRDLRVNGGLYRTQREAASLLGITHVELSHFEADRERPTVLFLGHAAALYRADLAELTRLREIWCPVLPPDYTSGPCSGRRPA